MLKLYRNKTMKQKKQSSAYIIDLENVITVVFLEPSRTSTMESFCKNS